MIIADISQKIQAIATVGQYRTWKRFSAFTMNFYRKSSKQAILRLLFSTEFQRNLYKFLFGMNYGIGKQAHFTGLQVNLQIPLQVGYMLIATPKRYGLRRKDLPNGAISQQAHPCHVFPMFACVFPVFFPCSFDMLFQNGRQMRLNGKRNGHQAFRVSVNEGGTR